jgi:hypothetical protein
MKKFTIMIAVVLLAMAGSASAITWAGSMADIYAAGGLDVDISGASYDVISSVADPFGGSIGFTPDVERRNIGAGWATWSHGYTGAVLMSYDGGPVRLDFDYTVAAFGFYAEPNVWNWFDITLGLSDGSVDTKSVYGEAGAEFFGFVDGSIDWLEISCADQSGFAFGEMVMAKDVIPEPATLTLLGLGLAGLGFLRRKRS